MSTCCRAIGCLLLVGWTATLPMSATESGIRFPGGVEPPVLSEIGDPGDLLAVAFSADGRQAAVASPRAGDKRATSIRLFAVGSGRTDEITTGGIIRALLHAPDGSGFYGLLHRPARRQPGVTHLVRAEPGRSKLRRLRQVASGAIDLEHWPGGDSLLILAENEIRSVLLDGLRSGPLFRVTGGNLSVATLAVSDIVLVGQSERLLLLRLDDPPGEEQMPVRESVDIPAPARALAVAADGASALARLEDGRVLEVRFDPLRIEESGRGAFVADLARAALREPVRLPPRVVEPPAVAEPEAAATEPPPPAAEPARRPDAEPAPEAPPTREPSVQHQLSGLVAGPAAADVREIVLFGPSNLLREAARSRPDSDGNWHLDGLTAGRYRIQPDGGGELVLISEPSFVLVEVPEQGSIRAPEIRILRSYRP